jgi:putative ribosome biogenesis GTPase RsgA
MSRSEAEYEKLKDDLHRARMYAQALEAQNAELEQRSIEDQAVLMAAQKEITLLKNAVIECKEREEEEEIAPEIKRIRGPRDFRSPTYLKRLQLFFKSLRKTVNVIVLGPYGSGKSSLVTTLATSLSKKDKILKGIAPAMAVSDHVTTALKKIRSGKVNIYDCWGFSEDNLTDREVERILDGIIKDGTSMHEAAQRKSKHQVQVSDDEVIHAAILVVDAVDIVGNDSVLKRTNGLIRLLNEKGMTPMIALNKIDLVDQNLIGEGLKNVFKSVKARERMHLVHLETGLSVNQIFPVKSYDSEWDRDPDVEKLALLCLKEVIEANIEDDLSEDDEDDYPQKSKRSTASDDDLE